MLAAAPEQARRQRRHHSAVAGHTGTDRDSGSGRWHWQFPLLPRSESRRPGQPRISSGFSMTRNCLATWHRRRDRICQSRILGYPGRQDSDLGTASANGLSLSRGWCGPRRPSGAAFHPPPPQPPTHPPTYPHTHGDPPF